MFNQLDDRNMGRIRYKKVSEADGEVVSAEYIVKGIEISKCRYVIVDTDELAPFVPLATEVDRRRAVRRPGQERPRVLRQHLLRGPRSHGSQAIRASGEGVESTGKVAIVRYVMRSRQYTAAVRADDGRLTMPPWPTPTSSYPPQTSRSSPGLTPSRCQTAK